MHPCNCNLCEQWCFCLAQDLSICFNLSFCFIQHIQKMLKCMFRNFTEHWVLLEMLNSQYILKNAGWHILVVQKLSVKLLGILCFIYFFHFILWHILQLRKDIRILKKYWSLDLFSFTNPVHIFKNRSIMLSE